MPRRLPNSIEERLIWSKEVMGRKCKVYIGSSTSSTYPFGTIVGYTEPLNGISKLKIRPLKSEHHLKDVIVQKESEVVFILDDITLHQRNN